ncbi:MAG: DNA replication/repair protein RecF [Actinomycetaceae bacterium]|nr:DNA replication/repair protein RecF [Actinomycetaceae bacterium]
MFISHLALDDFRSYVHEVIEFQPGVTVILGANGQGKTNLVEAIAYLARFASHRVAADTALVRFPGPQEQAPVGAVVRAKVHTVARERILELEIIKGRANRARLNRTSVRPRDLLGELKVVVFAPEDLILVKGDPSERRRFLDEMAVQMWPAYAGAKSDLDKILRQRGALLKQLGKDRRAGRPVDLTGLSIWNEQLVTCSRHVVHYRMLLLQALISPVKEIHNTVSNGARQLTVAYENSLTAIDGIDKDVSFDAIDDASAYEDSMRRALVQIEDSEIHRGVNLVGPHRDDLVMWLDDMPVKGYASHGESWSVALALKLASFDILTAHSARTGREKDTPILILDDVFSELDEYRRQAVLQTMANAEQVIITAAVGTDLPENIDANIIEIKLTDNGSQQITPSLNEQQRPVKEVDIVDNT